MSVMPYFTFSSAQVVEFQISSELQDKKALIGQLRKSRKDDLSNP